MSYYKVRLAFKKNTNIMYPANSKRQITSYTLREY